MNSLSYLDIMRQQDGATLATLATAATAASTTIAPTTDQHHLRLPAGDLEPGRSMVQRAPASDHLVCRPFADYGDETLPNQLACQLGSSPMAAQSPLDQREPAPGHETGNETRSARSEPTSGAQAGPAELRPDTRGSGLVQRMATAPGLGSSGRVVLAAIVHHGSLAQHLAPTCGAKPTERSANDGISRRASHAKKSPRSAGFKLFGAKRSKTSSASAEQADGPAEEEAAPNGPAPQRVGQRPVGKLGRLFAKRKHQPVAGKPETLIDMGASAAAEACLSSITAPNGAQQVAACGGSSPSSNSNSNSNSNLGRGHFDGGSSGDAGASRPMHHAKPARQQQQQQLVEFKFDLIVDGESDGGLPDPSRRGQLDQRSSGQRGATSGPQRRASWRKLADNVNESVEAFILDCQDVCLMSAGQRRVPLNSNEPKPLDNHSKLQQQQQPPAATAAAAATTTTTTTTTKANQEFDYVFQLARQALAYSFELLRIAHQPDGSSPTTPPSRQARTPASEATRHTSANNKTLNCNSGQATGGSSEQRFVIQLGATLFQETDSVQLMSATTTAASQPVAPVQAPSRDWFNLIDLIGFCNSACGVAEPDTSTETSTNWNHNGQRNHQRDNAATSGAAAPTSALEEAIKQTTTIVECSSFEEALECLQQLQLVVDYLLGFQANSNCNSSNHSSSLINSNNNNNNHNHNHHHQQQHQITATSIATTQQQQQQPQQQQQQQPSSMKAKTTTIALENTKKSSLLISLKLIRRINGGQFSSRMCLIDFDPNIQIELQCIFESIFNGQALAHLKRRKVHLEQIERELSQLIGSNCSIDELEKQHHHVASMKKLIQAEWLLYKQLGSASIRTLIIVHVHKLQEIQPERDSSSGHHHNQEQQQQQQQRQQQQQQQLNDQLIPVQDRAKQLVEQHLVDYNMRLLEFARLIQRASWNRAQKRKEHLLMMIAKSNNQRQLQDPTLGSNLSLSSLTSNLSTTSTAATASMRGKQQLIQAARSTKQQPNVALEALMIDQATVASVSSGNLDWRLLGASIGRKHSLDDNYHYNCAKLRQKLTNKALRRNQINGCSRSNCDNFNETHNIDHLDQYELNLIDDLELENEQIYGYSQNERRRRGRIKLANQYHDNYLTRRRHHNHNHHQKSHSHRSSRHHRLHHLSSLDCRLISSSNETDWYKSRPTNDAGTTIRHRRHHSLSRRDSESGRSSVTTRHLNTDEEQLSESRRLVSSSGQKLIYKQRQQSSTMAPFSPRLVANVACNLSDSDSITSANLNSCSSTSISGRLIEGGNNPMTAITAANQRQQQQMLDLKRRISGHRHATRQLMHQQQDACGPDEPSAGLFGIELASLHRSPGESPLMRQMPLGAPKTTTTTFGSDAEPQMHRDDNYVALAEAGHQLRNDTTSSVSQTNLFETTDLGREEEWTLDGRSEIDCMPVTEPPKQLKLEKFLHQLSSIRAPTSGILRQTTLATCDTNDQLQGQQEHLGSPGDRDEDEDCNSHSSILDQLSSLAHESNSKLMQHKTSASSADNDQNEQSFAREMPKGHLQRLLSCETKPTPKIAATATQRLEKVHSSARTRANIETQPNEATKVGSQEDRLHCSSVEEKLKALTIDCNLNASKVLARNQTLIATSNSIESSCCSSGSSDLSNEMIMQAQQLIPPPPPPLEDDPEETKTETKPTASIAKHSEQMYASVMRQQRVTSHFAATNVN